jgi:hypothetical protein
VVAPYRPPFKSADTEVDTTIGAINNNDLQVDHVEGKGEEKVEYKNKELVFIGGMELVKLDDCKVPDMRLHYDSDDTDDNNAPNLEDVDVSSGAVLCLQTMDPNSGPTTEPMPYAAVVHSEQSSEAIASAMDPLFNAAGKAPHPEAVFIM